MLSRRACRQPSVVHHFGYGAESRFLARREPSALVHSPSSSTTSTRVVRHLAAARELYAPVGSAPGAISLRGLLRGVRVATVYFFEAFWAGSQRRSEETPRAHCWVFLLVLVCRFPGKFVSITPTSTTPWYAGYG